MAMNYVQHIQAKLVPQEPFPRFLVSGVDQVVRMSVGSHLINSLYERRRKLLIIDNAPLFGSTRSQFGLYHSARLFEDSVSLGLEGLLNMDNPRSESRLRALLSAFEINTAKSLKVIQYLKFVSETERRLGNDTISFDTLEEYGGTILVNRKLEQLLAAKMITYEQKQYLLGRYSEMSAAAADFEDCFSLLRLQSKETIPYWNTAVICPFGEYRNDSTMQRFLSALAVDYLHRHPTDVAVLILDDGNGDRTWLLTILRECSMETEVHLLSNDVFNLSDDARTMLISLFPLRIYSRHNNMASSAIIQEQCGCMDVVHTTKAVSRDKRLLANNPWDVLFDRNRTETTTNNAPKPEPKYRKEMIQSLPSGSAIVDFKGEQVLFQFA